MERLTESSATIKSLPGSSSSSAFDGSPAMGMTASLRATLAKPVEERANILAQNERHNVTPPKGGVCDDARDDGSWVSMGSLPEPPPYEGLWGGRLADGYPAILYGEGSNGKSFLALALAMGFASGKPIGGLSLPKGNAAYLDWELAQEEQARRAHRIARGLGLSAPPAGLFYKNPGISLRDYLPTLKERIRADSIRFLVVDSLGPGSGVNPEDAPDIMELFNGVRELGVTCLLLDHQSKQQEGHSYEGKKPFGSIYKFNLARCVIQIRVKERRPGEILLVISHTKNNFGELAPELALRIRFTCDAVTFEAVDTSSDPAFAEEQSIREKIMARLVGERRATAEQLARETGCKEGSIKNALTALRKEGDVLVDGKEGRAPLWRASSHHLPLGDVMNDARDSLPKTREQVEDLVKTWPADRQERYHQGVDSRQSKGANPNEIALAAWEACR